LDWTGAAGVGRNRRILLPGPKHDSKLEELLSAFKAIWQDDGNKPSPSTEDHRFLLFSRTLDYLARALSDRKIANRKIHGGVRVEERERAIDDFLERSDVQVLLTSEVGGEV